LGLSDVQADAILQMQLRRLTALEADKIQKEHEALLEKIADLQDILEKKERIDQIIVEELTKIKEVHATPRRSQIIQGEGDLLDKDLIANEKAIILLTEQGYIKRMPVSTFVPTESEPQGVKAAAKIKEDDVVEQFMSCCDHDKVLFFSDRGVVYSMYSYQVPLGSRAAQGVPILQMLPISQEEKITSMVAVSEFTEDEYLIMLTQKGFIKKTPLSAFSNIRNNGLIAISLMEGDLLRWVRLARSEDSVIIGSCKGMAIHFQLNDEQIRPLGRNTKGVKAMKIRAKDELISMDIVSELCNCGFISHQQNEEEIEDKDLDEDEEMMEETNETLWLLAITRNGFGKRVPISQFRLQRRAGLGLRAIKFRSDQDQLAALRMVSQEQELMIVSNRGIIIRQAISAISLQSRNAKGVRVQRLDEDDAIAEVAIVPSEEGETEGDLESNGESNLEGETTEINS
jgi:DNA gyrase subunit A